MEPARTSPVPSDGKPQRWDVLFLIFLASSLLGAAYVGALAYREGVKTENTKRTGEALMEWLADQAAVRATEAYPHMACAARSGATWGACLSHVLGEGGPLQGHRNAFTGDEVRILGACGGGRSAAGHMALELVTPLPPGAAVPFTVGPLLPQASIEQKVTLRVAVCEFDGDAIRVGETEF
ncbi:MAG: hypothetical protein ACKOB5_08405 [Betaproteobacteria bacterium]